MYLHEKYWTLLKEIISEPLKQWYFGPDRLESIILKIIGKKIDNLPCHLQSIISEHNRCFVYYSSK